MGIENIWDICLVQAGQPSNSGFVTSVSNVLTILQSLLQSTSECASQDLLNFMFPNVFTCLYEKIAKYYSYEMQRWQNSNSVYKAHTFAQVDNASILIISKY